MSFLEQINANGYEIITALVSANIIAQVLKTLVHALTHKKTNLAILFTTGGMPSSHSSTVTAMATSIGLISGFESVEFAIGACLAVVVMYDSAGVRRAAGKQAIILNRMIEEFFQEDHHISSTKLKELLGHSPVEVFFGAILGIFVSLGLRYLIESNILI